MSATSTEGFLPSAPRTGGTIGSRLARILALPAVVVLLLLGVLATGQIAEYRTARATASSVTLSLAVQDLVRGLQNERGVTAAVLGGNHSFDAELGPDRDRVDAQRATVRDLAGSNDDIGSGLRTALTQLEAITSTRAETDRVVSAKGAAKPDQRSAAFAFFTDRIRALRSVGLGLEQSTDPALRDGAAALTSLQDVAESTAQERAFLNGVFSAGGFGEGEFAQFAQMRATRQAATDRFRAVATPEARAGLDYALDTGAARLTLYFERVALDAADGRRVIVNPQAWWSGLTTVLDDLGQLQRHVGSQVQLRAHELQVAGQLRLALLSATALACLVGSALLALLAARSITRPLATLAAEADYLAAERLPAAVQRVQTGAVTDRHEPLPPVPVPDRATVEVQSVAGALDRLQTAAYDLAVEQAVQRRRTIESLANLGRRNQNLIRRQLGFITALERDEIDPIALGNLFELDHLATRMRRNADSLLVLVGSASPPQMAAPVPVSEVIRAAVSEVEDYRRVALRRMDDAMVSGSAVGAVAHVLSELIENGLSFSSPEVQVEVQGRRHPDGYLIAITDQGVGMTADELALANSRLRGEGDFLSAPTRFLGHFVVGELARRINARVELLPSPVVGVTARVTLPMSLLSVPRSLGGTADDAWATTEPQSSPEGIPVPAPPTPVGGIRVPHTVQVSVDPSPPPPQGPPAVFEPVTARDGAPADGRTSPPERSPVASPADDDEVVLVEVRDGVQGPEMFEPEGDEATRTPAPLRFVAFPPPLLGSMPVEGPVHTRLKAIVDPSHRDGADRSFAGIPDVLRPPTADGPTPPPPPLPTPAVAAPAPPPTIPISQPVAHTRNGLPKRRSRAGDPQPGETTRPAHLDRGTTVIDLTGDRPTVRITAPPPPASSPAVPEATPSAVSARLTALRAGVRQSRSAGGDGEPGAAPGNGTSAPSSDPTPAPPQETP